MNQQKNQNHPGIGGDGQVSREVPENGALGNQDVPHLQVDPAHQQALKLLIERFKKYAEQHISGFGLGESSHQPHQQQNPEMQQATGNNNNRIAGNNEQRPGQAQTTTSPVGPADQQCPTRQALQQLLLLTQRLNTPEQKDQILQILKSSAPLMASFIPGAGLDGSNQLNHQQSSGSQRSKLEHQEQLDSGSGCPAGLQTPAVKQALQQLLAIIKTPITPEKQDQILQIIKCNPVLMAAFLKQRRQPEEQGGEGIVPLYPGQVQEGDSDEFHHIMSQLGLEN